MSPVLVIYASTHGQTGKIARRLAAAMESDGAEVDVRKVDENANLDPSTYSGIVVAASIHASQHQKPMINWIKHNRLKLDLVPNGFISVSLSAADDTEEAHEATAKCIRDFTEQTNWIPDRSVPVAGAIEYREYDVFTRTFFRLLMKQQGHPTDTSHDYEFTDWEAVDQLGKDLLASFGASPGS